MRKFLILGTEQYGYMAKEVVETTIIYSEIAFLMAIARLVLES